METGKDASLIGEASDLDSLLSPEAAHGDLYFLAHFVDFLVA
jgi:hypothetical protein